DLAMSKGPGGIGGEADERKTLEPSAVADVTAARSRQGVTANLPFAIARAHEIRLVILPVAIAARLVLALVVDTKSARHIFRVDPMRRPLHPSTLLIGSVAGNAGIAAPIPRQRFLQKIAEPLIRLGVVAVGERVAQKEESIRRNTAQLSLAQSKTVVSYGNRTITARLLRGGVWHGDPPELRIKLEILSNFEAAWPPRID